MKKRILSASAFFRYKYKEKYPIYVSKKCFEKKHVGLLLIGEEGKRHYVLIKDFNTFIFDHKLHCGKKNFCRYCLQTFNTEKILKYPVKDCFRTNGKQMAKMPNKVNTLDLQIMEEK